MARNRRGTTPDHVARSYALTHSLLDARGIPHFQIVAMSREAQGLNYEGQCEVLSRVIGNQLVLVDALLQAPGAHEILQGYMSRLSEATLAPAMAEVTHD